MHTNPFPGSGMLSKKGLDRAGRRRSSALVIVLTVVVLLTIVVITFLSQSIITRQMFGARSGQTQADILGGSAIEYMKADLREEIVAGSQTSATTFSSNNSSGTPVWIYVPTANQTLVPARTGFAPSSAYATNDAYANIVKVSRYATNFYSGSSYDTTDYPPPNWASPVSTSVPALNGRSIDNATTGWSLSGWDRPQLVDTTNYPTALTNASMPDWIYVTTGGRKVLAAPEADVVGRYAYVVYDEGGLLDINSAGYNSSLSTADAYDVARKASLGFADLTQIPGINAAARDALVTWRNAVTSSSTYTPPTTAYPTNTPANLSYLADGGLNKGFLSIYPGDQKFLSRQDLLRYQAANATTSTGFTAQSLAYLGTFTRTINAPTYTPIDSPGETFTPATTYAANAESGTWVGSGQTEPVYNRDIVNVRWPRDVTITRPALNDDTGTVTETVTFHQGDPVVQHRFPLSKIALLTKLLANPTAAGVVAIGQTPAQGSIAWAVLYYFGLEYDASGDATDGGGTPPVASTYEPHWEYMHCRPFVNGDGAAGGGTKYQNSIDQVATGTSTPNDKVFYDSTHKLSNREPDFFEMLQAGMLRGSTSEGNLFDTGVCVIDQATPTDIPTQLCYGPGGDPREFIGRKSLPYLCQMLMWPYRPKYDTSGDTIEDYLIPMLWNPHRNATTASTTVQGLRMYLYFSHANQVSGVVGPTLSTSAFYYVNPVTGVPYCFTTPYYQYSSANDPDVTPGLTVTTANSNYILTIKMSTAYAEPTILNSTYVTSPIPVDPNTGNPAGGLTEASAKRWGFFLGSAVIPDPKVVALTGAPLPTPPPWVQYTGTLSPTAYPATTQMALSGAPTQSSAGLTFRLQCEDSSGVWHTYAENAHGALGNGDSIVANSPTGAKINYAGTAGNSAPSFSGLSSGADALDYYGGESFGPLDPRMNHASYGSQPSRAGTGAAWTTGLGGSLSTPTGSTLRPYPSTATTQTQMGDKYSGGQGWGQPATPAFTPTADYSEMTSENSTALANPSAGFNTYYDDGAGAIVYNAGSGTVVLAGDGVTRPGDGYNGAYPLATVANGGKTGGADRPLILNRPFLSVGELGYAFRSIEWRTLDFSTVYSGDSGLLDLFSVNDAETANQQSLISGVVDLNTHNATVLKAVISGGLINGLDSTGAGISAADAQTMASAIVAETNGQGTGLKAGPLLNRAQLATRVVPLPDIAGALSTDGYVTKDRREAVVRSLAEPADTRTWNLLIDLVVQAGRYPSNAISTGATALGQFDMQGERHYWLHVALDRYTGKIIDEQIEAVHDD